MVKRKWTRESIIFKLRELADSGQDISLKAIRRDHAGLYQSSRKLFSNSMEMYEAADISNPVFGRMPNEYWTKDRIIKALRGRYFSGKEISYRAIAREDPRLLGACNSRFGSIYEAAKAAGMSVDAIRLRKASIRQTSKSKPAGYWTGPRVLSEIRELYSSVEKLSSSEARKTHHHLVTQAERKFGGWHKACEIAGIPRSKWLFKRLDSWTEDEVRNRIRQLRDSGLDLSDRAIRKTHPALQRAAYTLFGNWYNALEAAGISSDTYRRQASKGYWTKERVEETIKKFVEEEEDISARYIYRNHGDLYIAATRRFGTWEAAVTKAGFDYDSIRKLHKEYTRDELLAFLKSLQSKGIPLHISSVKEVSESKVIIISKRFGSYKAAIEAMGLDYARVRRDFATQVFKGRVFEEYVNRALDALGWDIAYQKTFRLGTDRLKPDFVDLRTGTWIDAKLSSYSGGVSSTVRKYQKHKKKVQIIYLDGNERIWPDGSVDFIPVSDYYDALKAVGAEDLVRDFEKLKKGVVRPDLQTELERFMRKSG